MAKISIKRVGMVTTAAVVGEGQALQQTRLESALDAWSESRLSTIREVKRRGERLEDYIFDPDSRKIAFGSFRINPPLIKRSRLTRVEEGGVGKDLSDGWVINYAIGCTHACRFCYVDNIHKRFGEKIVGKKVYRAWGNYFFVPQNIDEAIEETRWQRWKGKEAMMSSTHDPYLPQLVGTTRKILERALPEGVRFCVQTRSPLVVRDFDIFKQHRDQVRIQVSLSTMSRRLNGLVEPRVSPPEGRLRVLESAKRAGLDTGVIIAPVFPPVRARPSLQDDLGQLFSEVAKIEPDHIYGESLHTRGSNMAELKIALGERPVLDGFDGKAGRLFYALLRKHGLRGKWWWERKHPRT